MSDTTDRDQSAAFTDQASAVIALAYDSGQTGITTHDIRDATGWESSSRSRTLSDLVATGVLSRLEEKRNGAHVHVLPENTAGRMPSPYRSITAKHWQAGHDDGYRLGRRHGFEKAFEAVDGADTLGDALILLRRMIQESQ